MADCVPRNNATATVQLLAKLLKAHNAESLHVEQRPVGGKAEVVHALRVRTAQSGALGNVKIVTCRR